MPDPFAALVTGLILLFLFSLLFWPNGGIIGYVQKKQQLSNRILMEDALKYMFNQERYGSPITNDRLAEFLKIQSEHLNKLIKQLESKGLIYIEEDTIHLTSQGRDYATQMVRTHRLLERYFSEETGIDETDWHIKADKLEHRISAEKLSEIATKLGNPVYDPHGDPIPTRDGEIGSLVGKPLTEMPVDTNLRIVHLEDEPKTVYAQFVAEGLYPGMEIQIIEKNPQRIRFWGNGSEHILAPVVAANINVIPLEEQTNKPETIGEPLSTLKPGEKGIVIQLSPRLRHQEKLRMMDLGILPNTPIKAEFVSPSGDPTAYRVRGTLIALRKEQADLIRIRKNGDVN